MGPNSGLNLGYILEITEELNALKDIDAILDRILFESRKLTRAVAGSIFLVENSKLKFSYVHNDELYTQGHNNKHIYSSLEIPVNRNSIVGYVADTGDPVIIDDAYNIPPELPFHHNSSFDEKTGFHTQSMLTVPLKTFQGNVVGVIQIINCRDEEGNVCPFQPEMEPYISFFGRHATMAIERGLMTREMILRMMLMAELRDPKETGAHVQRVGAYSAEIYHRWALNRGIDIETIKRHKDIIRLASMLHDVGKIGISDAILKKPARLNDEEYNIMKYHTIYGARLFISSNNELDRLSREIALNHHEKWDGTGYPGHFNDIPGKDPPLGTGKKGEEIPITARITALADVFDALGSVRSYKDQWPDSKIFNLIREESGKHFDPEVVNAFFEIIDVIIAIKEKFQ
ncbi:HD domain-containing protein [Myxococcota bacterium]|nr:HD domain-containing protein [Myxococcota bacterium]MBU1382484.1 HD domain-containing protein [Myxococcota bacterium]MBU1497954.1 HD domain-containing protein [Myxococcota bacterium]